MKNRQFVLLAVALSSAMCLLGTFFFLHAFSESHPPAQSLIETFTIKDYEVQLQKFTTNKNVGLVANSNTAIEKAKSLWQEKYNKDIAKKSINISYDYEESCWHIYNTVSPNTVGGVYHAIIRNNGDVLAVWGED